MATANLPTGPSQKTIKCLFAHSGNRCAFPKCKSEIVRDGTIIGEICHICAANPSGPRYDPRQTDAERHSFENLILLCANHHTVIDDDEESYTVQRITAMKNAHEASATQMTESDATEGAIMLLSVNQSGGITAHSV